jgi:uncharacterized protein YoxC
VIDPLFWLGFSMLLVAVSLTAVLIVLIPAVQELGRAARSAEKLFDTLARDLPPTLESIRLTGLEITELTEDVTDGVRSAGQVVRQVDQSLETVRSSARGANVAGRSVAAGMKAAWKSLRRETVTREIGARDLERANPPPIAELPPGRLDPVEFTPVELPAKPPQPVNQATQIPLPDRLAELAQMERELAELEQAIQRRATPPDPDSHPTP